MTPQLQFFMILGAVALLVIIFAFLKRGPDERQVQPAVAGAGRGFGDFCAVPLLWCMYCGICWIFRCRSTWYFS